VISLDADTQVKIDLPVTHDKRTFTLLCAADGCYSIARSIDAAFEATHGAGCQSTAPPLDRQLVFHSLHAVEFLPHNAVFNTTFGAVLANMSALDSTTVQSVIRATGSISSLLELTPPFLSERLEYTARIASDVRQIEFNIEVVMGLSDVDRPICEWNGVPLKLTSEQLTACTPENVLASECSTALAIMQDLNRLRCIATEGVYTVVIERGASIMDMSNFFARVPTVLFARQVVSLPLSLPVAVNATLSMVCSSPESITPIESFLGVRMESPSTGFTLRAPLSVSTPSRMFLTAIVSGPDAWRAAVPIITAIQVLPQSRFNISMASNATYRSGEPISVWLTLDALPIDDSDLIVQCQLVSANGNGSDPPLWVDSLTFFDLVEVMHVRSTPASVSQQVRLTCVLQGSSTAVSQYQPAPIQLLTLLPARVAPPPPPLPPPPAVVPDRPSVVILPPGIDVVRVNSSLPSSQNPCETAQNPCLNGARCVVVSSSSMRCECPPMFRGPRCALSVFTCHRCVSCYKCTNITNARTMTLIGVGLKEIVQVSLAGVVLDISPVAEMPHSVLAEIDQDDWPDLPPNTCMEKLTFEAVDVQPSNRSRSMIESHGPRTMASSLQFARVDDLDDPSPLLEPSFVPLIVILQYVSLGSFLLSFDHLVYYSTTECIHEDQYRADTTDGTCTACPDQCAYCPGLIWPTEGCWSYDSHTPPMPCPNAAACPGVSKRVTQQSQVDATVVAPAIAACLARSALPISTRSVIREMRVVR
jgi:hypothetical protein